MDSHQIAQVRRSLVVTAVTIAVVATVPALTKVTAKASTGTGTTYALLGCRASTDAYIPGGFVCPTRSTSRATWARAGIS